jgi:hypothetical protein
VYGKYRTMQHIHIQYSSEYLVHMAHKTKA